MDFYPVLVAFSWSGAFWALGGCLIAFLALLMIISIVFLQDSKDGGLGGAFGSAGGGDALLGAGGQKGIVKITALISLIFTAMVIGWGMIDMSGTGIGSGSVEPVNEDEILNPAPPPLELALCRACRRAADRCCPRRAALARLVEPAGLLTAATNEPRF